MEKLTDIAKDLKKLLQEDLLYKMNNFHKNITGHPVNLSLQIYDVLIQFWKQKIDDKLK